MSSISFASSIVSSMLSWTTTSSSSDDSDITTSIDVTSMFGSDFLLSAVGAQTSTLGAAYTSTGASILPSSDSAAGEERTAILTEANALFKSGDYAGARVKAEEVAKKYPSDATPVYLIGRSYLMEGDFANAQTYLSRAATLASDSTEIMKDLEAAQTLSHGETAAKEQVEKLLRNARTASQGLQLANYALKKWSANLTMRLDVADYYEKVGRVDYAGQVYLTAMDEVPVGNQGDLVKRLEEFASDYSDDPSAHDLLAQAYGKTGQLSEAEAEFEKALELSEDDTEFQTSLKKDFADIYERQSDASLEAGNVTEALAYMEKAQSISWNSDRKTKLADMEMSVGETALRGGLTGEAIKAFTKAGTYLPTDDEDRQDRLISDYERLATRLTASGDLRRAVIARQGAYDFDSSNDDRKRRLADAQDTYGMSLSDQGKYKEAIRVFKAALKLYPEDANYKAHLYAAQHPS